MSGRKQYSLELKQKVVFEYLEGNIGFKNLADKYYISSKADVQKWVAQYRENGVAGLCMKHGTYTGDFKVSVVEYMYSTNASIRDTAAHFGVPSPRSVIMWEQIYREQGKEALYVENRGKASKMGTKHPRKNKENIDKNESLLEEVKRLRMENEYLKKLNALIQEREESTKPTK